MLKQSVYKEEATMTQPFEKERMTINQLPKEDDVENNKDSTCFADGRTINHQAQHRHRVRDREAYLGVWGTV